MKLSDLIRALEHVKEKHGDLTVFERRLAWYESTELFPDGIEVDAGVKAVASYHEPLGGKHHWDEAKRVPQDEKDRREMEAFVL